MNSDRNPAGVIVSELERRLLSVPFVPFRILVSNGKSYDVPTSDHLTIFRLSKTVSVEYDDRPGAYIHPLHITSIEPLSPAAAV